MEAAWKRHGSAPGVHGWTVVSARLLVGGGRSCSRAKYKLEEAWRLLGLDAGLAPGSACIDIGAARRRTPATLSNGLSTYARAYLT